MLSNRDIDLSSAIAYAKDEYKKYDEVLKLLEKLK